MVLEKKVNIKMKKLIVTMIVVLMARNSLADSVTSIETNNTPISGYTGEQYTDPTTHKASPNTNGTHIVNFSGTGITAIQTPNYGGSGLSQVSVNLNNLQTTQSISNTTSITALTNQVTTVNNQISNDASSVSTINNSVSNLSSSLSTI